MQLDQSQLAAVEFALQGRDCVVNGSAGTGKTSIIKHIADKLKRAELMCPTGKAAARLKQATGHDACTIHRNLMWDSVRFHRQSPFKCPVIIDESSMIDAWLMAKILEFNPEPLILVGDAAQLPPVGKGQPFHDLINLRPDRVATLTTCYRAQGAVHKAASAIRAGQIPMQADKSGGESWRMVETGGPGRTFAQLAEWIKAGYFDPMQDIILAPMYGSGETEDGGIRAANAMVKEILNPSVEPFAVKDRVIINKNFGTDDLWNGDLGTIVEIDTQGLPFIDLDRGTETRHLTKAQRAEMTLAYCLSVHKAQGSQMRRVFFVCFRRHWHMLSRSLIYTAITRAKEGVCVMGNLSAFYHGIQNVETKCTVLQILGKDGKH
jgi:exodeoxyribonuclease V alpha subunit